MSLIILFATILSLLSSYQIFSLTAFLNHFKPLISLLNAKAIFIKKPNYESMRNELKIFIKKSRKTKWEKPQWWRWNFCTFETFSFEKPKVWRRYVLKLINENKYSWDFFLFSFSSRRSFSRIRWVS